MQSSRIISETEEEEISGIMEVQHQHEIVVDLEFWPLQHPMQPDDEDRPVICPMPHSSLVHEGTMHNGKRTAESWRKRTEVSREVKVAETTVRVARKRHHHTLSRPDHQTAGMSRLPPLPTAQNFTIFQMLQQLDKFES
ncbi:uncharacterized protein LOC111023031 [Momordica charantia]|uniref:Uncharacterized protein LOC111023031 n=1 Tax=Momordica charantia TaxID=3673 RepID=A0A6J1DP94_MOMCH|nr:uncharacterized protein LOC111023031 [Momordica charantia]